MKLWAILFVAAAIAATADSGSSATIARPRKTERKPGEPVTITLRGEAAAYCYKQTHPAEAKLPSGRLEIETPATLAQVLPGGWLRFDASLPGNQFKKLLTISLIVSSQDIDKNQSIEVDKSRSLHIRTWSLEDEFVKNSPRP